MQSKTSFFNLALFKKNLSRTWIVGLLYFIFLLIIMPVRFLINMSNFEDSWYAESGYDRTLSLLEDLSYQPIAMWGFIIAIVVTANTFWYLFSKRDNYMVHAFPVDRKSLFFTGLISSSVVTLAPVILNGLVMTVAAAAERVYAFDAIWYWTLAECVSTLLFISIAMFSLMTSGQIVTGVIFYIIFNYLYIMMEVALRLTASILLFGMSSSMSYINYKPFSPILFIDLNCSINVSMAYDNYGNIKSYSYSIGGAKYLLIYAIAAVLIIGIAYMLYKRKRLETVQDFISVPFLKPVFTVGMSFFISLAGGAMVAGMLDAFRLKTYNARFTIAILATLFIGCIVFYATQMLIEKTMRVFSAKKFGFLLGYSVAALIFMLCLRADAFKVENRVPAAEDIAWVGVDNTYTMVFTDPEEINSIRELHGNIIADKKELRDVNVIYNDVAGSTLTIKYKLKNGDVIARDYSVVDTESDKVSAQYLAATEPFVDYLNNPTRIKQHIIGNIWNDCDVTQMGFSVYTYDEEYRDFEYSSENFHDLTDAQKVEKYNHVYRELLKDVDEGKVFISSFGNRNYYDTDRQYLYNDFDFTVYNPNVQYFSDEDAYWDYGDTETYYQRNIYATLTLDCTHTLQALLEEGFYNSPDDLLTYEEYSRIMENNSSDYYDD